MNTVTQAIEMNIAPAAGFIKALAGALESFGKLTDAERAALPGDAQAGISALRQVCEEHGDGILEVRSDEEDRAYCGRVIIEWPPPRNGILASWGCAIYDAETGKPVTTASKITVPAVTADVQDLITCELVMFADEDGAPVFDGKPRFRDDRIITGTFPFIVAEMRVRS